MTNLINFTATSSRREEDPAEDPATPAEDPATPAEDPAPTYRCELCDKTFTTPQGRGAHMKVHAPREEIVRSRNLGRLGTRRVDCPEPDCGTRLKLSGLRNHLRRVHRFDAGPAVQRVNAIVDKLNPPEDSAGSKAVERVSDEPQAKRATTPPVREPMPVEDACAGMLMGMTGRDNVPLSRLPDLIRWARETDRLVSSLLEEESS